MTNRDDVDPPTAEPVVPDFPLLAFRQKLPTLTDDRLMRLAQRLNAARVRLNGVRTVKTLRLAAAQRILQEYIQTKYVPPVDPTAVDDGLAAVDEVIGP